MRPTGSQELRAQRVHGTLGRGKSGPNTWCYEWPSHQRQPMPTSVGNPSFGSHGCGKSRPTCNTVSKLDLAPSPPLNLLRAVEQPPVTPREVRTTWNGAMDDVFSAPEVAAAGWSSLCPFVALQSYTTLSKSLKYVSYDPFLTKPF